ncbi:hypothetical protein [Seleniivibrio sp.]|uniref:hypothetical protein n=1 Tax=Seleniivibrio sp. TaxID=2898801 RepID=UPI0025D11C97|nr:hypothetical protein [Seleniivibrio sp.]MCD8553223.1 hypothetical protein [Seleniivibrio sp.]
MRTFIVSCDFNNDLSTESAVTGELNRHDGVRFKKDAWILRTESSSEEIFGSLVDYLKPETCVMIAEVCDRMTYHLPAGIASWLRRIRPA